MRSLRGTGETQSRMLHFGQRVSEAAARRSSNPQPFRRQMDLRHTQATLLRKAGVDLGAVQHNLGHSSPEITAAVYDHSDLEDFRADVERALTFAEPPRIDALVMQDAETGKSKGPEAAGLAASPRRAAATATER